MGDTHVHIKPPPGGGTITVTDPDGKVTTITITPTVAESAVNGVSVMTTAFPEDVEEMVQRHEKNGVEGTRSRELTAAMIERGWTAKAGPKYLRFIYTGSKGKVTLYANSRDLMTREYRDYADKQPGSRHEKNETRWYYTGDDLKTALMAADSMMAYVSLAEDATDTEGAPDE